MNGVGFLYRLRENPPLRDVPVMVITGAVVTNELRQDLNELRATLRFKPMALAALLEDTRALLDPPPNVQPMRPRMADHGRRLSA